MPTQMADCTNVLTYLNDLTVPDGTHFNPGTKIEKKWQVKNSGTCNWMDGYTIQLVGGDALGASESQALIPARNGTEAVIQIDFTAPQQPENMTAHGRRLTRRAMRLATSSSSRSRSMPPEILRHFK